MQAFINAWKEQRRPPILFVLLALGMLLFALSYLLPKNESGDRTDLHGDVAYTSMDLEDRLCAVLSTIEGVGQVRVLIHEETDGGVVGVLVVAEGAQELSVRTELMRAAMTALDVPASSVEVFAMQQTEGG